jgi:pyrimidine-specific ribonucleoside hydrolase
MWSLRLLVAAMLALGSAGCSSAPGGGTGPPGSAGPSSPPAVTLVIDTDVAPDDLVAISFLVAAPSVTIAAISVSGTGEAHCARGVANVLGLLERLDAPQIPVACGAEAPLAGNHAFPDVFRENADAAAGLDVPATTRRPADGDAVDVLRAALTSSSAPLRVLTLGPLTNIGAALAADPSLARRIESIAIMGGAIDVPGNVAGSPDAPADNTSAEWNIYVDPTAAAAVLASGVPIRLVSLDGTNDVPVTTAFVARARAAATSAPAAGVLAELFAENSYMTDGGYYLWDPLAAVVAAGYEVGTFTEARLTVDTGEGPTSGAIRARDGAPNASYLSAADAATAEDDLLSVLSGR